ncbi:hypothetical protein BZM26_30715 [Paraburkholderia strydomiana]|nr:hypothetical protein BZM26_30715 [Paraburkholderia strydomiana]
METSFERTHASYGQRLSGDNRYCFFAQARRYPIFRPRDSEADESRTVCFVHYCRAEALVEEPRNISEASHSQQRHERWEAHKVLQNRECPVCFEVNVMHAPDFAL